MEDQIEEMMQIEKRKLKENKERKEKANGKWGKKMKGKRIGRGKEKERRWGQDIFKELLNNYDYEDRKYVIVNLKKMWGNVICWQKWNYK